MKRSHSADDMKVDYNTDGELSGDRDDVWKHRINDKKGKYEQV